MLSGSAAICSDFLARGDRLSLSGWRDRSAALAEFVGRVKSAGQRRTYDCVVGVSGGVDSS
jgi:NH3-dependent NAD+ synthetase